MLRRIWLQSYSCGNGLRPISAAALALSLLAACGCNGGAGVPSSVSVGLPDASEQTAGLGEGAASLADTAWDLYEASTGRFLVTLEFDENGALSRLADNQIVATEVIGGEVVADGKSHATATDGLTYAAGTYGAENDSGFGFTARVRAYYGGLLVGSASASAMGEHDDETMIGTFSYKSQVEVGIVAGALEEANGSGSFEFIGYRVDAGGAEEGG